MEGADLVRGVTCREAFDYGGDDATEGPAPLAGDRLHSDPGFVLPVPGERRGRAPARRRLRLRDEVEHPAPVRGSRVPGACVSRRNAGERDAARASPGGVFLSNGPGDPAALPWVVENVRQLLDGGLPVFGICLGHQMLALALGARTFKLKFGHRGGNHPVKDLETGRVEITSQNHGFAVEAGSLPPDLVVTHQSLYDGTIEGLRHRARPVFCVQYHPEASPGPHDADYLFARFVSTLTPRA